MGAVLPALSLGLGVITTFAQIGFANKAAKEEKEAANRQILAQYDEIGRQQGEVHRIADEQVSDRIRAANQELGSVRTMALDRGVSGSTLTSLAGAVGYLEGQDITRINKNRFSNIEAGEAQKRAAQNGFLDRVTLAQSQRDVAIVGAGLNLLGSGLQIGSDIYKNRTALNLAGNPRIG